MRIWVDLQESFNVDSYQNKRHIEQFLNNKILELHNLDCFYPFLSVKW